MGFFEDLMKSFGGGHHGRRGGHHGGHHDEHHGYGYESPYPYPAAQVPTGATPGVVCPKCGSSNPATARFCQQCVAPLTGGQCAKCGAAMGPGVKFCSQCGQQI